MCDKYVPDPGLNHPVRTSEVGLATRNQQRRVRGPRQDEQVAEIRGMAYAAQDRGIVRHRSREREHVDDIIFLTVHGCVVHALQQFIVIVLAFLSNVQVVILTGSVDVIHLHLTIQIGLAVGWETGNFLSGWFETDLPL